MRIFELSTFREEFGEHVGFWVAHHAPPPLGPNMSNEYVKKKFKKIDPLTLLNSIRLVTLKVVCLAYS